MMNRGVNMMDTEKAKELLKHFKDHGVSHNPDNGGLQYVLDYQDVIGHSSKQDVVAFEESLEKGDEKKNFVWVNFLTLSQDMAIEILKNTVVHRFIEKDIEAVDDEYQKKYQEYDRQVNQLRDAKKYIYKKIRELEAGKRRLSGSVKYLEAALETAYGNSRKSHGRAREAETKARKYDTIKNLLM